MQTDNCINTASHSAVCNDITPGDVTSSLALALLGIVILIFVLKKAGVSLGDVLAWGGFVLLLVLGAVVLFGSG